MTRPTRATTAPTPVPDRSVEAPAEAPRGHRLRTVAAAVAVVLLGAAVPVAMNAADAAADFNCSGSYFVDQAMANGARWQMCWERRDREGIVLHEVTYTPPGGQPVEILGQAGLAQIHVPYDDNAARFHDLSDFGLGYDWYIDDLQAGDCPNGQRLADGALNVVCVTEQPTGYAHKDYDQQAQATTLNLFSVSHIGAYNYVVAWNFDDDGTIRPEVGATGSLQRTTGPAAAGWPVGGGRHAVAHMHNFYWRLDFDVAGTRFDDRVQELQANYASARTRFNNVRRAFTTEVARRVAPRSFRSWRVRDRVETNADNHPISFEILPNSDHVFRGPSYERFTHHELYVTRHRRCEVFASHNPATGVCSGAPNNQVSAFVNQEGIAVQDVVVWYGASFHHLPRDEDEPHMHAHWTGFSIVPRDLTATNPVG